MIKIDIILISYNQEQYILQALYGIVMQQILPDQQIRLVVSDDCSVDATLFIIKNFVDKIPFPVVILNNQENVGISRNYQRVFSYCKDADYLAIIEGDDYWIDSLHLQKHIQLLKEHANCVICSNQLLIKNEVSHCYEICYYSEDNAFYTTRDQARCNRIGNLSTCVCRNAAVQQLPTDMFDMEVDDWILGLALTKWGTIGKINEATSIYRINKHSNWAAMSKEDKKNHILARIEQYDKYLGYLYHNEFMELKRDVIKEYQTKYARYKRIIPYFWVRGIKRIVQKR